MKKIHGKRGRFLLCFLPALLLFLLSHLLFQREVKALWADRVNREISLYGAALHGTKALEEELFEREKKYYEEGRAVLSPRGYRPGKLSMTPSFQKRVRRLESTLFLMGTGSLALLFLLHALHRQKARQRERELAEMLHALVEGEKSPLMDSASQKKPEQEILELREVLYHQREAIGEKNLRIRSHLEDISHQIRTPLTSSKMLNELILDDPGMEEGLRIDFQQKIDSQLTRIQGLVENLLKLAKLESGTILLKRVPTALSGLWEEAHDYLHDSFEKKHLRLRIEGEAHANIDPGWTFEVVFNLLKNAVEHADEKSTILVTLEDLPRMSLMSVENQGPPILGKDLLKIFDRFYKAEHSRPESVGIGLNLAKVIVQREGGHLHVKNTGRGVAFTAVFFHPSQEEK